MIFRDRDEAALLLIKKLSKYKGSNLVVAGIPRGAMPMAKLIADHLGAELTAVLVHKIPSPYSRELAVGCVGLSGHIHQLPHAFAYGALSSYMEEKAWEELQSLKRRQQKYQLRDPHFRGRTVIIVDDGIATGATTTCAIHEVRSQGADRIILATPVAPPEVADELLPLVDEFIALYLPPNMFAIGEFYSHFDQVSDEEVIEILRGEDKDSLANAPI